MKNNNSKIRNGVLIAVITAIIVQGGNLGLFAWLRQPETNRSNITEMKNTLNSYIPIVENNIKQIEKITNILTNVGELQKKNGEQWEKQLVLNGRLNAQIEMLTANRRGYTKGNPINVITGKPYTDE